MNEIENEFMIQSFKDGIVFSKFKDDVIIDLSGAKLSVRERISLSKNQVVPILIDAGNMKNLTKEAREFLGSEEGNQLLSAAAVIGSSPLANFIANFFIKVNLKKTKVPVRLFADEDKALTWLNQFK